MNQDCLIVMLQGTYQGVTWQNFLITVHTLEDAYDAISQYVSQGLDLQEIKVRQSGQWTVWPVDAFTGQPLAAVVEELQQEIGGILAPIPWSKQIRLQRHAFLRRQVQFYERQVEWATQRTAHLQNACQQPPHFHDPSLAESHKRLLQSRLQSNQSMLARLQRVYQKTQNYLQEIEP